MQDQQDQKNLVSNWGRCTRCDGLCNLTYGGECRHCSAEKWRADCDLWLGPGVFDRRRAEERGRRRFHEQQQRQEQVRRRKRLEAFLPTKGRGCRQLALRQVIVEKTARSYTITLGCEEIDLGTDPSNTAHAVAGLEGVWLQRAGDRLDPREHLNATGEGSQRRCPGLTGAQPWAIQGLSEQEWRDLALRNETYGVKRVLGRHGKRAEGALNWATNWAQIGNRSATCHWLSRRCITAGLTEGEAEEMTKSWQETVPQGPGRDAYTLNEALTTLRSVYRLYDPTKDRQKGRVER